ncbi:MAG: hypothetical protein V7L23_18280 [Nostoc sp.]|uniref:hypothetical protein n=1 Tax=Nostoc sp. TaxID=1180 RepID=UPI002FF13647
MLKACACAGEQGSRGAEESSMCQVQSPPPLRPSAPLHFKLVRNAGHASIPSVPFSIGLVESMSDS